jgi:hypothetical protein
MGSLSSANADLCLGAIWGQKKLGSCPHQLVNNGFDFCNPNKKGGLFSRLQLRGADLNLRPLGYEFVNDLVRLCFSMVWIDVGSRFSMLY